MVRGHNLGKSASVLVLPMHVPQQDLDLTHRTGDSAGILCHRRRRRGRGRSCGSCVGPNAAVVPRRRARPMRQLALQAITARDVAARDPRVDILPCALHGLGRHRSNGRGCCGRSSKWERCCCGSTPRNRRRRGLGGRWRRDRRRGCRRGRGGRRLGRRPPAEEEPAPTTLWPLTNLRLQAQTARHLRARDPRVHFDRCANAFHNSC
mmetsp:Transcript_36499/g.97200  ORF Transcript_36499/g.97200 Transcript_36499/m.97200 type:complete len:207 (-) Transcript_36499:592-1212(-)